MKIIASGGCKGCKMMRGFQICPPNWHQITFDALLGKKTVENMIYWVFCQFSSFLGQKGVKMLFDLNFETRFGILSSNDQY